MIEAGQQDGEDAGEKDPVERSSAADRGDRRAEARDFIEVGEIGADQRAHAAGDISERRGIGARQQ